MKRFLSLLMLTGLLFGQDIKYDPDTGEPIDVENIESSTFDIETLPTHLVSKEEIEKMSEEEKMLLYGKYKINPFSNTLFSFFIPTLGYYRINQWQKRGRNCTCIYLASGMVLQLRVGTDNMTNEALGHPEERRDVNKIGESFAGIFIALHLFDVYNQTKKYNGNLYQYIFGQKAP